MTQGDLTSTAWGRAMQQQENPANKPGLQIPAVSIYSYLAYCNELHNLQGVKRVRQPAGKNYYVIDTLQSKHIYSIKLNMINTDINIEPLLKQLGQRLKEARLARNESQELFAQRLGLTRQSYSRMEKGSPQTLIGNWLAASSILGRLADWQEVLAEKEDLFAKLEKKSSKRQRAGGRRKRKK